MISNIDYWLNCVYNFALCAGDEAKNKICNERSANWPIIRTSEYAKNTFALLSANLQCTLWIVVTAFAFASICSVLFCGMCSVYSVHCTLYSLSEICIHCNQFESKKKNEWEINADYFCIAKDLILTFICMYLLELYEWMCAELVLHIWAYGFCVLCAIHWTPKIAVLNFTIISFMWGITWPWPISLTMEFRAG